MVIVQDLAHAGSDDEDADSVKEVGCNNAKDNDSNDSTVRMCLI